MHLLHLSAETLADFILVHSLRGDSMKVWKKGSDVKLPWLQNWLPFEPAFRNINIRAFG